MPQAPKQPRRPREQHLLSLLQARPSIIWKTFADGHQLRVHLFFPSGHSEAMDIPCVAFFHGGMWIMEHKYELVPWALQLTNRGVALLIPEYRCRNKYDLRGEDILQDAHDFWEWISANAPSLGIDPTNITLAGADAGGLMALHAGMPPLPRRRGIWPFRGEELLPNMPAALAIFRGVVDVNSLEAQVLNINHELQDTKSINPAKRLRSNLPPLFSAHGELDPLQDVEASEWFCDEWSRYGNPCENYSNPTVDHTLMNFNVNPQTFEQIFICWDQFMTELGLWQAPEKQEVALMI